MAGALTASILLMVLIALGTGGTRSFGSLHRGAGAFYQVIPYAVMWTVFMAAALYVVIVWIGGVIRFWKDTNSPVRGRTSMRALLSAFRDALTLRYMRGGGAGCDYPTSSGSYSRLVLHSLVFYGFLAAFAATVTAAVYQDIFGVLPPYPVLSAPVVLGALGGIGLVAGSTGLLYLKRRADPVPSSGRMVMLDYAFLALLDLVGLTGIALLIMRDSGWMPTLLALHLGSVLGLFVTAPYGKFVHFAYRSAALIQNRLEERGIGE